MSSDIVIGNVKYRRVHGDWTMTPNGTRGMFHIDPRRRELLDEIERLRAALRYIERPTMSLPGGADAEQHALIADERAVRLALQTCIRTAREALSNGSADATEVGGPS